MQRIRLLRLNTAVGTRNYFFFYTLALCGKSSHTMSKFRAPTLTSSIIAATLQHTFHLVVIILSLTTIGTQTSDGNIDVSPSLLYNFRPQWPMIVDGFQVLLVIYAVVLLLPVGSYGSLLCFHSYLLSQGHGTFDWMIERYANR